MSYSKGYNFLDRVLERIKYGNTKEFALEVAKAIIIEYEQFERNGFKDGIFDCAKEWIKD
ncbi:MAG TPA: hypothetical protein DGK91_07045 [Clostridium sp.]|jgi:hypothetical protein|nr:hypothetical protein [Clostridium sp.]